MIKACTGAPYNHASIALDPELKELYSFGRKRPTDPWHAGFIKEDVYDGTYRLFPDTRCAVLRYPVAKRKKAAVIRSIEGFQKQKDLYRYNLFGLLGVLFRFEWAPKYRYFCSQIVAEVLGSTGDPLWSRPPALVAPNDFLIHPSFELVYEGLLLEYPLLHRNQGRLGFQRLVHRIS